MPRERTIASFIIKRMDYGESDQIITLFSKEEGKLRALVKAAKLPTSKLQPVLQPLFQTAVALSGSKDGPGLPKVIGVQLIKAYSGIMDNHAKMAAWYVVTELLMRALPDNAPNENLFDEFESYALYLHSTDLTTDQVNQSVIQFQIKALAALGLGIRTHAGSEEKLWFSLDRGGFVTEDSVDAVPIRPEVYQSFQSLSELPYALTMELQPAVATPLSSLINRFVTHQLEREIKSQSFLV